MLLNLSRAFDVWVQADQTKNIIFDVPYDRFIAAILKRFSVGSMDTKYDDNISLTLKPGDVDAKVGVSNFTYVASALLQHTSQQNGQLGGLLGCNSLWRPISAWEEKTVDGC